MDVKRNGAMTGALLLIAGAAIGAGIALLFAPQSGEKTRKDIVRYSRNARRKVEELAGDLSRDISGMVDTIGESTQEIIDKGKDLAEDRKKALLSAMEEGVANLTSLRAKLARRIA